MSSQLGTLSLRLRRVEAGRRSRVSSCAAGSSCCSGGAVTTPVRALDDPGPVPVERLLRGSPAPELAAADPAAEDGDDVLRDDVLRDDVLRDELRDDDPRDAPWDVGDPVAVAPTADRAAAVRRVGPASAASTSPLPGRPGSGPAGSVAPASSTGGMAGRDRRVPLRRAGTVCSLVE